ncbi:T9SS type A sorting domain-containing protein [Changchengzhania lutea]|uniref:T9SS type A sorting domain-containing protein n=1 Tax=Changchengzhania lutea TaxID=2049305 RepID=UPI00163DDDEB|nr:T9SS type A sorting domain-containing protein [Changchengzhania lutea]
MKQILTTTIAIIALAVTTFAQTGSIDTTFDPGTGTNSSVYTSSIQSDGKIIIGGFFVTYNGTASNRIARLNVDGTLDANFNLGTGANSFVLTNSIQNDGKIIIGGLFTSYNGTAINRIARLNADGTLDGSFAPGTGANNTVETSSLQSDGKIIIGGDFTSYNGTAINRIARLNADGTLDGSFAPGTGVDDTVRAFSIQGDGKIIIGGDFTTYNGTARNRIARLNADGTLDGSFNPGTGADSFLWATSLQSDGKIIIGGFFTTYNGTAINQIARLNVDGTLDTTFNPGTGTDFEVQTISLQSDGKIFIGGAFTTYNGTTRNRIARLNVDGTLDGSFNPGTGTNNNVLTISIQSDGNIIIGGSFNFYNGTGRNMIARILGGSTMGLTLIGNSTSITVYPNPFSLQTTLQSDRFLKNVTMTVYNIQGQVVKEIKNISGQTVTLFRDNLPSGLYFIQMTEANKIITAAKLVITD